MFTQGAICKMKALNSEFSFVRILPRLGAMPACLCVAQGAALAVAEDLLRQPAEGYKCVSFWEDVTLRFAQLGRKRRAPSVHREKNTATYRTMR